MTRGVSPAEFAKKHSLGACLGPTWPCLGRKRERFSMLRRVRGVRHQLVRRCLTDCLTPVPDAVFRLPEGAGDRIEFPLALHMMALAHFDERLRVGSISIATKSSWRVASAARLPAGAQVGFQAPLKN